MKIAYYARKCPSCGTRYEMTRKLTYGEEYDPPIPLYYCETCDIRFKMEIEKIEEESV